MLRRPWWATVWVLATVLLLLLPYWKAIGSSVPLAVPLGASFDLAVFSLLAAGWVSLRRASQRSNGTLMLILGLTVTAVDAMQNLDWGPWGFTASTFQLWPPFLIGLLLLRWPRPRLQTRPQLWFIRIAFIGALLLPLLDSLAWDPSWIDYQGQAWWPKLLANRELENWLYQVMQGFQAVLLVVFIVLITRRLIRASRPERRELIPVVVAAAAAAAVALVQAADALAGIANTDAAELLSNLSLLAVPFAFLLSIAVRRVQRALAVESLLLPQRLPSADAVRRALSRALGDKDLTLALWSPEGDCYLEEKGTAAPEDLGGRHAILIIAPDRTPLARIGVNARLAERADLVEAIAGAAGVALVNARLQAELQAEQRDTQLSRNRLSVAEHTQRRISRLLPAGLAERVGSDPDAFKRTDLLTVTVLISDIRGYSAIAELTAPAVLATQLNEHRQAMNQAVFGQGGTVMQYVGDAVLAVFGAPDPQADHEAHALFAAAAMHAGQDELNAVWAGRALQPFGLGVGLCTGQVAAAFLGSEERVEYTVVGDTVNIASRLCDAARPAGTSVASAATMFGSETEWDVHELTPLQVKGRATSVSAYRIDNLRGQ